MSYANRLSDCLKSKGLTSNGLSVRLGISSTAVWNWMHGNTEPKPDMLIRVANELGVSPDWLKYGNSSSDSQQTSAPKSSGTVQEILADAKTKLSAILQIPEHRIRLELNLNA